MSDLKPSSAPTASNKTLIRTLLIANRGEIAVRIIRTARDLGIRTVAIFAEADRAALHVQLADSRVSLGDGPVNRTYLNAEKILTAMARTGADAVHPGYGFLSEDAGFAKAVQDAGSIWVGPPVTAMLAMASKASAKQTLAPKGVPMIPGYHGDDQADATFLAEARQIGLPLLVKASAGGGGKGMQVVEQLTDLVDALATARREAKNSFGDDRLLLEKYLIEPRHVEVQILADSHGRVISLFERDCSVQRRHQKVLEEAPAPFLSEATRQAMWLAAETAAAEIGYVGAGTVEFILAASGEFFFLEMNTRLQVEHPVTELIADLDLVAWQLRIAAGAALTYQRPTAPIGHAIEVRLYAEDPAKNFQPVVGTLNRLSFPSGDGIRVDSGVVGGDRVSPFYDPMLAKIIVHAQTRAAALSKLQRVLAETRCVGLTTNLAFLRQLSHQSALAELSIHTRWLDAPHSFIQPVPLTSAPLWAALAQVLWHEHQNASVSNPWQRQGGWRMDGQRRWSYCSSADTPVDVVEANGTWTLTAHDQSLVLERVHWHALGTRHGQVQAEVAGLSVHWDAFLCAPQGQSSIPGLGRVEGRVQDRTGEVWLDNGDRIETVSWWQATVGPSAEGEKLGRLCALLPGIVTAVYAQLGDRVAIGDKLLSLEAMKMETTQVAQVAGILRELPWQVGEQISEGDLLFDIELTMFDIELAMVDIELAAPDTDQPSEVNSQ
jgi:3-methylcrotonyl-CoA carboxylase alpha subunit